MEALAGQARETVVADMRSLNRVLGFDPQTGVIEAEAGTLLSDIIAHAPHGYFPAVVPGTQFVTLGGAIANDVHGKNHHRRGSFGCHVVSFTLLRSDGKTYECSAAVNPRLFAATIGGMGLTGIILSARLRLMSVPSLDVMEEIKPFSGLAEYFDTYYGYPAGITDVREPAVAAMANVESVFEEVACRS